MENDEKNLKDYEIGFLAKDEKGTEVVLSTLKQRGAEILLEGPVERITLAYPIEHETSAFFGYMHFRVAPAALADIRGDLAHQPSVLRSLIITPPFMKQKPRWDGGKSRPIAAKLPTTTTASQSAPEPKASLPLSNEALEKQIEEILK